MNSVTAAGADEKEAQVMRKIMSSLALVAAVAAVALGSLPAAAQGTQCAARAAILDRLSVGFAEQPVSIGVTSTGSLLEVLASAEGTWTIIVTLPGGPTCLVSSGEGWHNAPIQVAADPGV
jgi:hypothetical protein